MDNLTTAEKFILVTLLDIKIREAQGKYISPSLANYQSKKELQRKEIETLTTIKTKIRDEINKG